MKGDVRLTGKAKKQKDRLPEEMQDALMALLIDLRLGGPAAVHWPHYGKLKGKKADLRHCHLNKGKPRYVAVWEVLDGEIKLMEVKYVGTHENAPY
ncbi:hypothetical protein FACS1894103_7330 [Campylobacterota bacterium]|nr:hypothetical protein FACS1894103_7330 [Campylobacterota bacterium]